ncbi:IPTL-CTERM sorting domain-containing protein [Elongatibacter sediminis]|uniref:IPTL-CTERM sorting domain-containing protein n=1 Tax=Elongatibacter sediminis TaxID=3119006 RepID=A0AAW9R8A1_9GAMM
MTTKRAILALLAALLIPGMAWAQEGTRTTFYVNKDFTDNNPGEVAVTITCNTGLPLEQTKMIKESPEHVEFVVVDFDDGELDCSVVEGSLSGYAATYDASGSDSSYVDDVLENPGCHFDDIADADENFCVVTNEPEPVTITVTKEWIYANNNGNEISDSFNLDLDCDENIEIIGSDDWDSNGNGSHDFSVRPTWEGGTCDIDEGVYDSAIESDDSGCQNLTVGIGQGDSCTVTNTVFYEGIPTLSHYGLAIMALLMAGVGFVGFRRFV